jgi:hypothetical protein
MMEQLTLLCKQLKKSWMVGISSKLETLSQKLDLFDYDLLQLQSVNSHLSKLKELFYLKQTLLILRLTSVKLK